MNVRIGSHDIGPGQPVYIIAELSANHGHDFDRAVELLRAAKGAGADAVKLQTYTADTITIDSDAPAFRIGEGTVWAGRTLHDLYEEAHTPWEWHPRLKAVADELAIDLFSSPFDETAVDFLEGLDPPAYKIASFEIVDHALIRKVAGTGRPVIISTGMATLSEIDAAVHVARSAGAAGIVLLRCNSAYPAPPSEMDLLTIPHMASSWGLPVGLSDHTLTPTAAVVAVTLGACVLEKHLTLDRSDHGPDSGFSLEPEEFTALVAAVREAERARGTVRYGPTQSELPSTAFRRSLFVVEDIDEGAAFTRDNVRSIRPAGGLPPPELDRILDRRATTHLSRGTPLTWEAVGPPIQ